DRGDEDEALAVRRVGGGAVVDLVVGDVGDGEAVEVEREDVELPLPEAGEGDVLAVRRPGGGELLLDVAHVDDARDSAVEAVDQDQAPAPLALDEAGDRVAVRGEGDVAPEVAAELLLLRHQVL